MHLSEIFLYETTKLIFHLQISLSRTYLNTSEKEEMISLLPEIIDRFLKLKDLTSKEYLKAYERFQKQLIESANSSTKQWNLIHKVRNKSRTGTTILSLRNCCPDVITDNKK